VGTIVSRRAPTIVVADHRLSAFLAPMLIAPAFMVGPLSPPLWKAQLARILVAKCASNAMLAVIILLTALNGAVIVVALRRFKRSTLLLG